MKEYEENNLMAIGSGLTLLGAYDYSNISITEEYILIGDDNVSLEIVEILEFNRWYYDNELKAWRWDLAQLEE